MKDIPKIGEQFATYTTSIYERIEHDVTQHFSDHFSSLSERDIFIKSLSTGDYYRIDSIGSVIKDGDLYKCLRHV